MLLPDDDVIELPEEDDDWLVISETDPPAPLWDLQALLEFVPAWARTAGLDVRDALLRAIGMAVNLWWAEATRQAHAQQSPRYAAGRWLDWWGNRLHRRRAAGEGDPSYRARLLSFPAKITVPAIRDAVDGAIGDLYAPRRAILVQPTADFPFWSSTAWADSSPHCYWQSRAAGTGRIWANGRVLSTRTAGAYWVSATLKAEFWIIVPATVGSKRGFWGSAADGLSYAFWGKATDPGSYYDNVWLSGTTAESLSLAVRQVNERAGGGVVWLILVDGQLGVSITR